MPLRPAPRRLCATATLLAALIALTAPIVLAASGAALSPGEALYCQALHLPPRPQPERPPPALLGIVWEPAAEAADLCPRLARIAKVLADSPAAAAGMRTGDLLLTFDGQDVCGEDGPGGTTPTAALATRTGGTALVVEVLRDGEPVKLRATLASQPRNHAAAASHSPPPCSGPPSLLAARGAAATYAAVQGRLAERSRRAHSLVASRAGSGTHLQRREVTGLLRRPLQGATTARVLSTPLLAAAATETWQTGALLGSVSALADGESLPPALPARNDAAFAALLAALEESAARITALLARLPAETRRHLRALDLSGSEPPVAVLRAAGDGAAALPPAAFLDALAPLLAELTAERLAALRAELRQRFPEGGGAPLFTAETVFGKVLVGGPGNDLYTEDAALILDLGGDDLYRNNAGGSRAAIPVALVVDWDGDDHYLASADVAQGAGFLGAGLLLDLGGHDRFVAGNVSQGAGLLGVGLLLHRGAAADYQGRRLVQGSGAAGLGLLAAGRGDDAFLAGDLAQGFGAAGGVGALVDGAGDDHYLLTGLVADFRDPRHATVSLGQGCGDGLRGDDTHDAVPGGIGLLVDGSGNDLYQADYFAQGVGYYFGLGLLDDRAGDDRYRAGRYAQGAGVHTAVGMLLDDTGNDSYDAATGVAQGAGHDGGVGLLVDAAGDDRYTGGFLVQGAATSDSFGLLLDGDGSNSFRAADRSQGHADEASSLGLLVELGKERIEGIEIQQRD